MFEWLVKDPKSVLAVGGIACALFLILSFSTGQWHWFPRGGAVMGLAGFLVSVREALLYRPAREPTYGRVAASFVRRGPFGTPVFAPNFPSIRLFQPDDQEKTADEIEAEQKEALRRWEEAEPIEDVVDSGDPGREMRDTSEMNPEELKLLRTASIFGVGGTLIWAFGDLVTYI